LSRDFTHFATKDLTPPSHRKIRESKADEEADTLVEREKIKMLDVDKEVGEMGADQKSNEYEQIVGNKAEEIQHGWIGMQIRMFFCGIFTSLVRHHIMFKYAEASQSSHESFKMSHDGGIFIALVLPSLPPYLHSRNSPLSFRLPAPPNLQ
jgi:hypothetical protein